MSLGLQQTGEWWGTARNWLCIIGLQNVESRHASPLTIYFCTAYLHVLKTCMCLSACVPSSSVLVTNPKPAAHIMKQCVAYIVVAEGWFRRSQGGTWRSVSDDTSCVTWQRPPPRYDCLEFHRSSPSALSTALPSPPPAVELQHHMPRKRCEQCSTAVMRTTTVSQVKTKKTRTKLQTKTKTEISAYKMEE